MLVKYFLNERLLSEYDTRIYPTVGARMTRDGEEYTVSQVLHPPGHVEVMLATPPPDLAAQLEEERARRVEQGETNARLNDRLQDAERKVSGLEAVLRQRRGALRLDEPFQISGEEMTIEQLYAERLELRATEERLAKSDQFQDLWRRRAERAERTLGSMRHNLRRVIDGQAP